MPKNRLTCLLIMLALLAPLASFAQGSAPKAPQPGPSPVENRQPAPAFALPQLTGGTVSLADFKGKPTVIVFTTTWCPYCIQEIPELKRIYGAYRTRGVGFAAIYVQESPERVKAFAAKHKLPYPILIDQSGAVARAYAVRGVPTKVLIDPAGQIFRNPTWNLDADLANLLRQP